MGKERAKGGRGRTEGSPKARGTAMESKESSKGKGKEKQLELQRQAPCLSKYDCVGSLFIKEIRLASHDSQLLRSP